MCDLARRKKFTLFVTFVDFSQAYDRVPRHVLFGVLRRLGCGSIMLCALIAMYNVTESWIGSVMISVTLGVRQGSPTSCLLFIIFMDDLIRMIKEGNVCDGFLQCLHILVMMDDTVLLSTSRHGMVRKLTQLQNYCTQYGMAINQSKTQFFVINGTSRDVEPMVVDGIAVRHCDLYIYLGSPFTSDGSPSSAVKAHAKLKLPHVLKFVSFLRKNNDVPFIVKRRFFDAALTSTLLYGCESWVGADIKPASKLYNWCIKELLAVRRSTCNDVCYVESGYPPLSDLVKLKQHRFFHSKWQERSAYADDPLYFVMNLVKETNTVVGKMVRNLISNEVTDISVAMHQVGECIRSSESSRRKVYMEINPTLSVNPVYKEKHVIKEYHRMSFTRFRVSGHSLACETEME